MLYLSRITNTRVEDSADNFVGRLKDVLIISEPGKYSPLLFLLIKGTDKKEYFIKYEDVEILSQSEIGLKALFNKIKKVIPPENCVYLNRDVLDQQIVDVDGARVVRVNDVKIGLFQNDMCILGLDVSFRGLLRRLNIQFLDVFNAFKVNLIDWRKAQLVQGELKLDTLSKDLIKLHPADLANIVEDLSLNQGGQLFASLDKESAAKVFEEIEPDMQKRLIAHLGVEKASEIIEKMSDDEIVDLIKILSKEEAHDILESLENRNSPILEHLIKYDDDTAGGLMTTDYLRVDRDDSVGDAVDMIKKISPKMRSILYVYVTDKKNNFLGSVSLRRLLVADKSKKIKEVMKTFRNALVVRVDQEVEDVINLMTKYNLFTVAVIDEENKMCGVIAIDDIMRHMVPNA